MSGLLKALGLILIARTVANKTANGILKNLKFGFGKIRVKGFRLDKTVIDLIVKVDNRTPVAVLIEEVGGVVSLGRVKASLVLGQSANILPDKSTLITSSIKVENAEFLIALGEQINSGVVPKLTFTGHAKVGYQEGKTVRVPINQNIPIQVL